MPGSAQPWDLPEDPREQTVDLPRIDLASYANGEAGHLDIGGSGPYPGSGRTGNGRSDPPAGPRPGLEAPGMDPPSLEPPSLEPSGRYDRPAGSGADWRFDRPARPPGPSARDPEPRSNLEPRPSTEPHRNLEPRPSTEPHGRFLPDSSRDPYARPGQDSQPGGLLRPMPAPDTVRADSPPGRPESQAAAQPQDELRSPLAGSPDAPPPAGPRATPLPAPVAAEPLVPPLAAAPPLPAPVAAEPFVPLPAAPPSLLAPPASASPAPAPPPAASSSPLGERTDTAEQTQALPPPRRRRESRDDGRPSAGSISDLRARLDRLPDGHPSSPYEDGGLARPLPHRLRQLELGLPAPERDHAAATAPREPQPRPAIAPVPGETGAAGDDRDPDRDAAETVEPTALESAAAPDAASEPGPDSAPTSEPHPPEGSRGDELPSGRPAAWQDPYAVPAADGSGPDHRTSENPGLALGLWRASADANRPERRSTRPDTNGHTGAGHADADRAITAQFRASSLTHDQGKLVAGLLAACRAAEGRNMFGDYDESGLTPVMRRIGAEFARGGLAPGSEADALKSPERLAAKLARLIARHPGRSAEELTAGIGDGIRYAFTFDADFYTEGTWLVHRRLKEQGFELEARRNRWDSPEYKGVWTRWRDPSHRLVFEVQFHTSASWEVVRRTHRAYVQITDPATPATERARLRSRQVAAAAAAKAPPRCTEISDFGREAR